jgi:hypothetical protein
VAEIGLAATAFVRSSATRDRVKAASLLCRRAVHFCRLGSQVPPSCWAAARRLALWGIHLDYPAYDNKYIGLSALRDKNDYPHFWLRLSSPAAELDTLDGLCGLEGLAVAKGSGKIGGLCDVMGLALSKGSGEIGGLWVGNLTGMGGKRLG